ncbi:MAG: cation diffusion facilitator family transporter [Leptolyngbya sp. SIO4C5]|nr:cation diffusion facilitator family transporter [Leptolyngbya sp. SIO4C5]
MTRRLLMVTLWMLLLILAVEAGVGWVSQSLSLLAESLHTLVDGFSTVLSLIAVASPQRTLGREIWGHGRTEVACTLLLVSFLGFAGFSLIIISLQQMETAAQGTGTAFSVSLDVRLVQLVMAMILVQIGIALFCGYQAKQLDSLAFKLNTNHILQDSWISLALLLGLLGVLRGYRWLDPLLSILLVGMAGRSLWQVMTAQLPMLLRPTAIAPEAIAQIVNTVEGVLRCTRIRTRGMVGRQVWVEVWLVLHPEYLVQAQQIGEQIEAVIRDRYGPVRALIWIEENFTPMSDIAEVLPADEPYPFSETDYWE